MWQNTWDRRYSCPHTSFVDPATPEPSLPSGPLGVDLLDRNVHKLLIELQGITHDLLLSKTTPIQVDYVRWTGEERAEKASEQCEETESLVVNPDADVQYQGDSQDGGDSTCFLCSHTCC